MADLFEKIYLHILGGMMSSSCLSKWRSKGSERKEGKMKKRYRPN